MKYWIGMHLYLLNCEQNIAATITITLQKEIILHTKEID